MEWNFHRDRWFVSDQTDFGDTSLASGDIGMAKSGIELWADDWKIILVNWGNEICLKWASLNNQMLFKPYPTYFYGISKFLGKWNSDIFSSSAHLSHLLARIDIQ